MSSGTTSLTILSEEQKFNRENILKWNITLNCTDITGLGVKMTGTAKEAWDSIQTETLREG
jgi:hypothetical protein